MPQARRSSDSAEESGGLGTILLVEDEPAIRQLITMALQRAGYRVVQAKNGAEALEAFTDDIDLLLTDLHMPYVSGEALIAATSAAPQFESGRLFRLPRGFVE